MSAPFLYAISSLYVFAAVSAMLEGKEWAGVCFLCFALSNVALSRMG